MKTGTVKFFKEDKGFGFIIDDDDQTEYFVHISGCNEKIKTDDRVTFEVGQGKKGEIAMGVTKIK
jgi:CspA family cold shock protein